MHFSPDPDDRLMGPHSWAWWQHEPALFRLSRPAGGKMEHTVYMGEPPAALRFGGRAFYFAAFSQFPFRFQAEAPLQGTSSRHGGLVVLLQYWREYSTVCRTDDAFLIKISYSIILPEWLQSAPFDFAAIARAILIFATATGVGEGKVTWITFLTFWL